MSFHCHFQYLKVLFFFQIFSISTSNLTAIDPDILALLSSSYSKILEEKLHYAYSSKGVYF